MKTEKKLSDLMPSKSKVHIFWGVISQYFEDAVSLATQ